MTTASIPHWRAIRLIAADIKLAHSVFAMPFAILAAFMAAAPADATAPGRSSWIHNPLHDLSGTIDGRRFVGHLILIVLAMIFARTVAMLANRLLDRDIDRANPRTAQRAIPSGRLSPRAALTALLACAAAFLAVCAAFGLVYQNWWPIALGPLILLWISAYALLKRYTALCHLYLGSSLAISPLAAAMAVDPSALRHQPALYFLSGMVLCWVAGFDIIYALQDVNIDRAQNLHSLPSRIGEKKAMWISRILHLIAVTCLVILIDTHNPTIAVFSPFDRLDHDIIEISCGK